MSLRRVAENEVHIKQSQIRIFCNLSSLGRLKSEEDAVWTS